MLKGAMLVGKPVLAYNTNRAISHVHGTLIDHDTNRLAAFWVNPDGREYQTQILPWSGVKAVEPDRVVAWSVNMLASVRDLFSIQRLVEQKPVRPGMRFRTVGRQDLGAMVDVYFDENSGLLEGYEVVGSDSAGEADHHGFLPAVPVLSITESVVVVPDNTLNAMQEKPGGLSALLSQFEEDIEAEGPASQDTLIRHLLPQIRGLRVQRSVRLPNGVIVAAHGQIVTTALIQRAQAVQTEQQLIEAVGIDLDAFQPRRG